MALYVLVTVEVKGRQKVVIVIQESVQTRTGEVGMSMTDSAEKGWEGGLRMV